jgi:methionyl-tRNA formyltransferase
VPVGALTLPAWDRTTLVRKLGQWGVRESVRYARAKLTPGKLDNRERVRNPYLESALRNGDKSFRNLHDVARAYDFSVATYANQNSSHAISQIKSLAPDLAIFTGGNILRNELLTSPRLGVLNAHLSLLPEIRGMSSPEWSLLYGVPLGVTIHCMDAGIDTGPILLRREFTEAGASESLTDLRNRMIAFGIDLLLEAVSGLDQGKLSPVPQPDRDKDHQFFVMHDRLKAEAERRLQQLRSKPVADRVHR